jgi:hypothetical protein
VAQRGSNGVEYLLFQGGEYGCKRGGKRVPAPRPHKPQGSLRGDAVNPHVPLLTCGLCGNPRAARAEADALAVARAQGGAEEEVKSCFVNLLALLPSPEPSTVGLRQTPKPAGDELM